MSDRCNVEIKFGGALDDSQVKVVAQALANDSRDHSDWIERQIRATEPKKPFTIEFEEITDGATPIFEKVARKFDLSYEIHRGSKAYVLFIDGVRHYTEVSLGNIMVPLSHLEKWEKAGTTLAEIIANYARFDREIPPLVIVTSARERMALDIVVKKKINKKTWKTRTRENMIPIIV